QRNFRPGGPPKLPNSRLYCRRTHDLAIIEARPLSPDVSLVLPLTRSRSIRTRDLVFAPVDSPLSIADGLVSDKHWKVPGLAGHGEPAGRTYKVARNPRPVPPSEGGRQPTVFGGPVFARGA